MTIYNATARTEESIRKERMISESEKIVPSISGTGEIYLFKRTKMSNRSLVQRIELIVKDAKKKNCDHAIISGDEIIETLLTREFKKHGIGVSWTSQWWNDDLLG